MLFQEDLCELTPTGISLLSADETQSRNVRLPESADDMDGNFMVCCWADNEMVC